MLLEAPFDPLRRQMNSVLLTVDLTKAVADEAIERKDSVIVAYRKYSFLPVLSSTAHHIARSDYIQGFKIPYYGRQPAAISTQASRRGHQRKDWHCGLSYRR